jgi:hypothetical protein
MRRLAAVLMATLVLVGGAAAATTPPATKWNDKPRGYSIIVPPKWYPVPRSVSAVNSLVAQLKKLKKTGLADAYAALISTAEGKRELSAYVFQAFLYDGQSFVNEIPVEVSIQVVPGSRVLKPADLTGIGDTYANALVQNNKGAKITVPKRISLPAGPAEFMEGTIPNTGGPSTGLELYILVHGKRIYVLSFKIDATILAKATVFKAIAEHFAFL